MYYCLRIYTQSSMEDTEYVKYQSPQRSWSNGINALLREKMHAQLPSHTLHNWPAMLLHAVTNLNSKARFQGFTFIPTDRQFKQQV